MAGRHRQQPPARRGRGRHRNPPSRSHLVVPAVTVAAVIAGGGVALGLTQSTGSGVGTTGTTGATPPTLPAPILSPLVVAPSKPPGHPAHPVVPQQPKREPAALQLRVVGASSWVEVTWQGRVLEQRIVHPGQRQVFRKHGLDVVLGNAGAVRLKVNGRRAHRAGSSGQVRRFVVH